MPGEEQKAKRRKVTVETKLAILEYLDTPGASIRKAAAKFDVSKKVVQGAKVKKAELLSHRDSNLNLKLSRMVESKETNVLLFRWFTIVRAQGFPISGAILQEKGRQIGAELGLESFNASEGWFSNWKQRHNVSLRAISGESGNVDNVTADQWMGTLEALCSGYLPKNIFNMDETGYFYRALPDKTLEVKSRECKGGKLAKDRITIALTCSWAGEKLPPLVIGKSKSPRCFRNVVVTKLNSIYSSSKKAWMTNPLFNEYLLDVNERMKRQGRKILLFIDNAPVHIIDSDTQASLDSVKVIFFPPNLTSLLQPLDGGIIRSLKARARKYSILKLLMIIGDNNSNSHASDLAKKFTVLDAINFIDRSWDQVTVATITKCFRNSGFNWAEDCGEGMNGVPEDVDDSLSDLFAQVGINEQVVEEDIDAFQHVEGDEVMKYVIQEHHEKDQVDEEDAEPVFDVESSVEEIPPIVSDEEAMLHAKQLTSYLERKGMNVEAGRVMQIYADIRRAALLKPKKQLSVLDFFSPE